jgi:hypothetical protein
MICDVYQVGEEKDHLLLCDGLYVINGAWNLTMLDGKPIMAWRPDVPVRLVGQIDYHGNYNDALVRFQELRSVDKTASSYLVRTWCPTCRNHNMDALHPTEEAANLAAKMLAQAGWPTVVVPASMEKS